MTDVMRPAEGASPASGPARRPPADDHPRDPAANGEFDLLRRTVAELRDEVVNLRRALDSRGTIEQAKGAIMAASGCSPDEAFELLREISQVANEKLAQVAADVLADVAGQGARPPYVRHLLALRAEQRRRRPPDEQPTWRTRRSFPRALEIVEAPVQLRALVDVASRLAGAGDLEEVTNTLVTDGLAALGAYGGVLALLREGGALTVSVAGYPAALRQHYERLTLSDSFPVPDAVRSGRAVFCRTPEEITAAYPQLQPTDRTQAVCALPLVADRVTLGGLGLAFDAPQTFDTPMRAFFSEAARYAAAAVNRSRGNRA